MEVKKITGEEGLCTRFPCVFELSKDSSSSSKMTDYKLNENIDFPAATNKPTATMDDNTKDGLHLIGSLEEKDCTLLIHNILQRDNVTYLFYADQGRKNSAFPRDTIELSVSGDIQSHAIICKEGNSEGVSDYCVVFTSPDMGFIKP
jgi:hypothetical protein